MVKKVVIEGMACQLPSLFFTSYLKTPQPVLLYYGRVIYRCHSYNNVKFVTARVASQRGQKTVKSHLNCYEVTLSCYILCGLHFLRHNKDI